jgi:hypothetical protein
LPWKNVREAREKKLSFMQRRSYVKTCVKR